jgi:trimethyllysine dioxygenase
MQNRAVFYVLFLFSYQKKINKQTGGFWDFTADLALKDTAYTTLPLRAHTDNTYFTDPAGLQMFHLLSHTHGSGGVSLFVDGFAAARSLHARAPDAYAALSRIAVPAHASGNAGASIRPCTPFPVINHYRHLSSYSSSSSSSSSRMAMTPDELMQIRWNNDDRGTMPHDYGQRKTKGKGGGGGGGGGQRQEGRKEEEEDMEEGYHASEVEEWYRAARRWVELIRRPEAEYWHQLQPGRPVSMCFSPFLPFPFVFFLS